MVNGFQLKYRHFGNLDFMQTLFKQADPDITLKGSKDDTLLVTARGTSPGFPLSFWLLLGLDSLIGTFVLVFFKTV
jgi:hypothetical protein